MTKETKYHVGRGYFGIYAGVLDKTLMLWKEKSDATDEAIVAVRDYMIDELLGGLDCSKASSSGWEWNGDSGTVELRITIKNNKNIKEKKENANS